MVVVEILAIAIAIAIRNWEDIKRIKMNNTEIKVLQYADDTTVTLSDKQSFNLLNDFEKVSGLKIIDFESMVQSLTVGSHG